MTKKTQSPVNSEEIWLSKDGDVYGPYTPRQIQQLKDDGRLYEFAWQWTTGSKNWTPITPAPPLPNIEIENDEPRILDDPSQPSFSRSKRTNTYQLETALEAICHDQKDIVSGKIQWILEKGFMMTSKDFSKSSPPFHRGRLVSINLLDPSSGYTENLKAEIVKIIRKDDATWAYEFRWNQPPKILNLDSKSD